MRTLAYGLLLSIALMGPASAACFSFGCTDEDEFSYEDLEDLSCNQLYRARNVMYAEAGYCFKTKKAKQMFKKYDCEIDDMEDIELSGIEYANIAVIQEVEKDNGCAD
jgi:hypothetical protein